MLYRVMDVDNRVFLGQRGGRSTDVRIETFSYVRLEVRGHYKRHGNLLFLHILESWTRKITPYAAGEIVFPCIVA